MTDHYTPWLKSTGRIAAGALLMVVAAIAVIGTKQWVGLVFVVIGAVSVGMGIRATRLRKRALAADGQPVDSQGATSQPGP